MVLVIYDMQFARDVVDVGVFMAAGAPPSGAAEKPCSPTRNPTPAPFLRYYEAYLFT
jgi:hypothetical protein